MNSPNECVVPTAGCVFCLTLSHWPAPARAGVSCRMMPTRLRRRAKALIWGIGVGGLVGGIWFRIGYDPNAHSMLLPGESPHAPMFSALRSAAFVSFVFGAAGALLVGLRPERERKDHEKH